MRHRRSSWIAVMLLGLAVMGAAHVEAARSFNGTSDSLQSASTVNLTAYFSLTHAFWLWVDSFANDSDVTFESGASGGLAGSVFVSQNHSGGAFVVGHAGGGGVNQKSFTRPSTGAWHHYVVVHDFTQAAAGEIVAVYVDGISQSLTNLTINNSAGPFGNLTLNLMSRNNASLFAAGRLAEVCLWGGYQFTQANVDALYNDGLGALCTLVQSGSLIHYWPILGDASPEPATVGGINLTVNGTTQVAHPFGNTPSPHSRAPRLPRQRPATR